jgi:hypothetical protein
VDEAGAQSRAADAGTDAAAGVVELMERPLSSAWDAYRRRRNVFWLVWATYVPALASIGVLSDWLLGSDVPVYVAATAWMIAFLLTASWMTMWKCPR